MSLSRPRARLTVDGRTLTSAQAALVRVTVALSLSGSHDAAEVTVWPSSKLAAAAPGAAIAIALGEEGNEQDVWAGELTAVAAGGDGMVLDGLAGTVALSRRRVSQSYLDRSVADVVRELASGAAIDEVAGGAHLPAYAVDDRRPVWDHVLALARLTGAEVGASPAGALRFVPPKTGVADWRLRYGADVLSWSGGAARRPRREELPAVAAYGAASEAGAEQWHWIARSPRAATAGLGGAAGPLRVVAALRTRAAAGEMGQALARRAARAGFAGRLTIVGRPAVRPGDLVAVSGLPAGDPGTLRVRALTHRLDGRAGFVTMLAVEAAGEELP
jgi:phage protein D